VRVALISPYALSVFGGAQEQVLAMSRELSRRGHDVLIVAPDASDPTTYDTPAEVLRFGLLVKLPANGSRAPLTLSPLAARRAARALTAFKPDVVHFHEPFAPLLGWSALRTHGAPAVATFHRSGEGPATKFTTPLLRSLARGLDEVAAVSEAAAETMGTACGRTPVVLFNGFEMDRFVATPRERTDEILLVTLGRFEERKGVAHAINAVRAHNAKGGDQWRLVVLGDGPHRRALASLAARDEMVVLAGAPSDEAKRAWLRRADALIAPALHGESFGLILLEGMASETSVVASDIPGYRDAAGGHAVLVAPGDDSALEAGIVTALASETPARIAAARMYAQAWSMTTLMDRYLELYTQAGQHYLASK
jgi:phosphatidyl-myo-inositol alpha-mannosyltransferase